MDFKNFIKDLRMAILTGDVDKARELAKMSIDNKYDPQNVINEGIRVAMDEVGDRFSTGEFFLPDLVRSGEATKVVIAELKPRIMKDGGKSDTGGKIVIGTVKGDIHEIGKTLVTTMLMAGGFEVIDLGVDVPTEKFIEMVEEENVEIVGLSALLTTTMPTQKVVIEALEEAGLRKSVKVIIGGAPTDAAWAEKIGADAYCDNAVEAVRVVRRLMN
jgi:corrinoid protein of di/trimethylamine methyltransferase